MLDTCSQGASSFVKSVLREIPASALCQRIRRCSLFGESPTVRDVSVSTTKKRGNCQSSKRCCSCARRCGLCMVLVGVPSCYGCLRATVLAHSCVCWLVTVPLICLSVSDKAHSVPRAFRVACRVCCVLRRIQCRMLAAVCVASAFAWLVCNANRTTV